MPGWHVKTAPLVNAGKLKVLGITQEQHPDRTVLFMQWQQMNWPVMLDSLNLLDVSAVPITLLIDGNGLIRYRNPNDADLEAFLATKYPDAPVETPPTLAFAEGSPEYALLWEGNEALDRAIAQWTTHLASQSDDARAHFRLGGAYRRRYDSSQKEANDFNEAVAHWQEALRLNPDQYIWRRRIQQYGPQLDKPYSFYDWIHEARETITRRGDVPHVLVAEPHGTELAYPGKDIGEPAAPAHPDPEGRVTRETELIRVESTAVASTQGNQPAYRVHLHFTPNSEKDAHWNNEAGRLRFFTQNNESLIVGAVSQTSPTPETAESTEERILEFDVRLKEGAVPPGFLNGSAFYYVCEGTSGTCLFRAQEIRVTLP